MSRLRSSRKVVSTPRTLSCPLDRIPRLKQPKAFFYLYMRRSRSAIGCTDVVTVTSMPGTDRCRRSPGTECCKWSIQSQRHDLARTSAMEVWFGNLPPQSSSHRFTYPKRFAFLPESVIQTQHVTSLCKQQPPIKDFWYRLCHHNCEYACYTWIPIYPVSISQPS